MNQLLQETIYSALTSTYNDVYLLFLPNEELLQKFTIIYTLTNTSNINTFELKEVVKTYDLEIQMNNPTANLILSNVQTVKNLIYSQKNINNIKMIQLSNESLSFDFDLKIFKGVLNFTIQYCN